MANPPDFVDGFIVNMENPQAVYGQVFIIKFNHILETPPRPENVNILIIPGLPNRMYGANTGRGVSIAYQRLNTLNPKWLGGDVAKEVAPKEAAPLVC